MPPTAPPTMAPIGADDPELEAGIGEVDAGGEVDELGVLVERGVLVKGDVFAFDVEAVVTRPPEGEYETKYVVRTTSQIKAS
jgi:hypothetical protein